MLFMPHYKNKRSPTDTSECIQRHGKKISDRLSARGAAPKFSFPDDMTLRSYSLGEVAEILGVVGQLSAAVVKRWAGANTGARDRSKTLLYASTDQRTPFLSRFGPSERGSEVLPAQARG
uniref:Uncharacterized protein n=1 Tax=Rhizobium leguminosarum TaxID=384 RepID=A0A154IR14_RHILE|nr:hypothetical protein A4A59_08090 [Rhizobium leguminosarum]